MTDNTRELALERKVAELEAELVVQRDTVRSLRAWVTDVEMPYMALLQAKLAAAEDALKKAAAAASVCAQ